MRGDGAERQRAAGVRRGVATPMQKGILLVGSLLIGLLLLEIVIAASGLAPRVSVLERGRFRLSDNKKIGYEPIPNLEYEGDDLAFFDYRGRSNRLGFRDRNHTVEKAPGTYRIIVLGDSVAAGLKVEDYANTYPALLESLLREVDPAVEVLSFAVSGYNTQQEVETLRVKGLPFDPDLVVLAYCLNDTSSFTDLLDALLSAAGERDHLALPTLNPWLVESALYRFVRYRALPMFTGRDAAVRLDDYAELAEDTVGASFRELAAMARDGRFTVLVAVFPSFYSLANYLYHDAHAAVRDLAEENRFHYLDLLPFFLQCRRETNERLAFDRYHPTERGHLCAAAATAARVERLREEQGSAAGP